MFLFLQLVNNTLMYGMRTRFLSVIIGFLLVSMGISSCLDSETVTEYSTDATIHAFSLDTIHGVDYPFEIDQLNNLIYNPDSLPVDADTIIDSIKIDVLSVLWSVTSGDTVLNTEAYHNLLPAMNATGQDGIKLLVHAGDGMTTRPYTLQIRVHRQDPDSLTWVHMDTVADVFTQSVNSGEQKAVLMGQGLNKELLVYTSPTQLYRTSANPGEYGWTAADVTGLPAQADVTSLLAFGGRLYMLASGDVYASDATGTAWQKVEMLSGNVQSLVATLPDNDVSRQEATLIGICQDESQENVFCTITEKQLEEHAGWTLGEKVPSGFPTEHIYYANYTTGGGAAQVMVAGMPLNGNEKTVAWFSNYGLDWASLETDVENMWCPAMQNPVLLYYAEQFYAFGGAMDAIYTSESGIGWQQVEEKFLLPAEFKNKRSYTVVVDATSEDAVSAADKRDFIWVIFGGNGTPNEVWRGRLSRLGFERE